MVNVLMDFRVIAIAREKSRLVSFNAISTDKPASLANAAVETPPVIIFDVIRPSTLGIVLKHFIFFANLLKSSISSSKYASTSVYF